MSALLNDASVIKDNDLVGIADGGETMSYDEGGATLHDGVHAALYQLFGVSVDAARCLIENQHWWISHRRTCNGQELSLTRTEVAAVGIQLCLVAVGQAADEVIGSYQSGGLHTLLVGSIEFSVTYVV